jgi:hypothetical protein
LICQNSYRVVLRPIFLDRDLGQSCNFISTWNFITLKTVNFAPSKRDPSVFLELKIRN